MISFLDQDFHQLNECLHSKSFSKIFILVDENTHEYCLPILLSNLETDVTFEIIEIESGEEMKTLETASQLWEILIEMQADRKSLVINLGGGVITDLGGFVASVYKRGISFIHLPTTLLSMCDASLGGKTGIDFNHYKNMIGTFVIPENIFIYTDFLKTLSYVELRSGFAEMLKHGLITDISHWNDLIGINEISFDAICPYIEKSVQIKQSIVEQDFKEENIRKTLNFGHTFGHAIESLFLENKNPIPHGEAVALGMIMETQLSLLENLISQDICEEIIVNIQRFFPYISIKKITDEDIISLMLNDKKNNQNEINFSLLKGIGNCNFDYKVDKINLREAIQYYRNLDN